MIRRHVPSPRLAACCALVVAAACRTPATTATATVPSAHAELDVAPPSSAAPLPEAGAPTPTLRPQAASAAPSFVVHALALPGANGHATLDYLAFDGARDRLWVPVAETASVDVIAPGGSEFQRVDGFATADAPWHGKTRKLGPSSASVGPRYAYVGDRASREVCSVDAQTLRRGACLTLASPPDGVVYVAPVDEVWVTTPRDTAIVVLDASASPVLKVKTTIRTPGEPEGYAVDAVHGRFITNLEDKNRTLAIDLKTHAIESTWPLRCGDDGPRGVALDPTRPLVFVACTDHVEVLDGGAGGAPVARFDTGAGVDNIDWLPSRRWLYVAAARAATMTVAHVDDEGRAAIVATVPTVEGARNAVVDGRGDAYVADPGHGGVLAVSLSSDGGP